MGAVLQTEEGGASVELTVLMPCLNEAETLERCILKARDFLARTGVSGEILVADNGSDDGSQAIARRAGARVVDVAERGYGAALLGGCAAARGRFVIMGDADDSYDFSSLDAFLDALRGGADLVMGNRFRGGIKPGAMPFLHRYLGNPVLSFLGRLFFDIPVGDFHCGLRGYRRAAILGLDLASTGMEYASEMVVKASLARLKIAEVPTVLSPDGRSRAPHLKTWRDGWRHLRFLLLHSPKWLFAYPGAVLLLTGVLVVAATSRGPSEIAPGISIDYHSLIGGCFAVLLGANLLLFSVMARAYAASEGFLPQPWRLRSAIMGATLERLLILALLMALVGAGGAAWSLTYWADRGFGDIPGQTMLRIFVPSLTAIVLSVQVAAAAFFASALAVRRRSQSA
jgi:glycosyltransferase involved in cell wall biosynthesis